MKIEKAIETLTNYKMESAFEATTDLEDALKLGIEALERHGIREHLTLRNILEPLPGETEE